MANPKGKDTVQLIEEILKKKGLTLEKGKGLKPTKMKTGGFTAANYSSRQWIEYLANRTGNG
jgi:hypothetical protein